MLTAVDPPSPLASVTGDKEGRKVVSASFLQLDSTQDSEVFQRMAGLKRGASWGKLISMLSLLSLKAGSSWLQAVALATGICLMSGTGQQAQTCL